jgi:hypothetical protein
MPTKYDHLHKNITFLLDEVLQSDGSRKAGAQGETEHFILALHDEAS